MNRNIFSPRTSVFTNDSLADYLLTFARFIFGAGLVLLPLFYWSTLANPIGQQKSFLMVVVVFLALLLACLAHLRRGLVNVYFVAPWLLLGAFLVVSVISALLSDDMSDAVWGLNLEVQSVAFLGLMVAILFLTQLFIGSFKVVRYLFYATIVSVGLVLWFTILGLVVPSLGEGWVSNGQTIFGNLNDLALLAGAVVVGLIATIQAVTRTVLASISSVLILLPSLFILAMVNFSLVWLVTVFFSLLSLLYLLSKDTWLRSEANDEPPVGRTALLLIGVTVIISGAFVVSGDYLSERMNSLTGVSYLEVRPSFGATMGILRSVYQDDVLLGIGPNRFEDAWRQYKPSAIATTPFWSTNFVAGSSYMTTLFVNTGVLGGILFLSFLWWLLWVGYRLLMVTRLSDKNIYLVGSGLFAITLFGWFMAFWYSPGAAFLLMLAVVSGLLMTVYAGLNQQPAYQINVRQVRQHGLFLIAVVLVAIVGAGSFVFTTGKQVVAFNVYAMAQTEWSLTGNMANYDVALSRANNLFPSDIFVGERARLRLAELNRLLALPNPAPEDESRFESTFLEGIELANRTVLMDPTNPYNYALRGSFLGIIADGAVAGMAEERSNVFATARRLDPQNPEYNLLEAQLVARHAKVEEARALIAEALQIKSNYIPALVLQAELDIASGNTEAALATTRAMINIDPNNPARHYQLGLLLSAVGEVGEAKEAFLVAVQLDPSFANARYLLAMALLDEGDQAGAIKELRQVAMTNADNTELADLIANLEAGGEVSTGTLTDTIRSGPAVSEVGETVISNTAPESDLLVPVNRIPATNQGLVNQDTTLVPSETIDLIEID